MTDQKDCTLLAQWAKDHPVDPLSGLLNALTPEARGLRSIDTAPRDGTRIWLFSQGGYHAVEGFWNLRMQWFPLMNPEYWLPL